jgi:hypothetical protein
MNRMKKYGPDIVLMVVSVIVSFAAIDLFLYYGTHYRYAINKADFPQFYFTKDAELGFAITPNFATTTHYFEDAAFPVWSNNIGCFDTAYASETPSIYLTGDSLTWGFVPLSDSWGSQLQRLVGMRTVKCGVTGGYGTIQELIRTKRDLARMPKPKVIIVGYTPQNDVDDDARFPNVTVYNGYLVPNLARGNVTEAQAEEEYARFDTECTLTPPAHPILQHIRCFLSNHSVLYNLFRKHVLGALTSVLPSSFLEKSGVIQANTPLPDLSSDAAYQKHLEAIVGFKDLAQKEGIKLLFELGVDAPQDLKTFLDKNGIAYIDFTPIFKTYSKVTPLVWKENGHWNIAGNHLGALILSEYLITNDFITVADKDASLKAVETEMQKEFGTPWQTHNSR